MIHKLKMFVILLIIEKSEKKKKFMTHGIQNLDINIDNVLLGHTHMFIQVWSITVFVLK